MFIIIKNYLSVYTHWSTANLLKDIFFKPFARGRTPYFTVDWWPSPFNCSG